MARRFTHGCKRTIFDTRLATAGESCRTPAGDGAYRLRLARHCLVALRSTKSGFAHDWPTHSRQSPAACTGNRLFHFHATGHGDTRYARPFWPGAGGRPSNLGHLPRLPVRCSAARYFGTSGTRVHTAQPPLPVSWVVWLACFGLWSCKFAPLYWKPRSDGGPG